MNNMTKKDFNNYPFTAKTKIKINGLSSYWKNKWFRILYVDFSCGEIGLDDNTLMAFSYKDILEIKD